MKADFYSTLGVAKGASDAELKSAYRKMAMKYHPDRNPGDEEAERKFKEISEAYEALKDPQKRAAYDRFGHAAFENGGMGGAGGFGGGGFTDIFEEFFGDMMGGRRRSGGRDRGADLRYNMEITLEEAFNGKTAEIRVPASMTCEECSGSGAKPGTQPTTCSMCSGTGPRARHARLLLDRARLSAVPGPRPDHRAPLPQMFRPGPRRRGTVAVGQTFRPASRMVPASGLPMKARPGFAAGRPAISTSSCRSSRTSFSSATAPISTARFRSR